MSSQRECKYCGRYVKDGSKCTCHESFYMRKNADLQQQLTTAQAEIEALREENERVRQANLDVMMHFDDMRAEKEKAEARVAELVEYADGPGELAGDYNWEVLKANKGISKAWLLRKQAEAVEAGIDSLRSEHNDIPGTILSDKERALLSGDLRFLERYAQRLKSEAEQEQD